MSTAGDDQGHDDGVVMPFPNIFLYMAVHCIGILYWTLSSSLLSDGGSFRVDILLGVAYICWVLREYFLVLGEELSQVLTVGS